MDEVGEGIVIVNEIVGKLGKLGKLGKQLNTVNRSQWEVNWSILVEVDALNDNDKNKRKYIVLWLSILEKKFVDIYVARALAR
jgi:hypothetical protein